MFSLNFFNENGEAQSMTTLRLDDGQEFIVLMAYDSVIILTKPENHEDWDVFFSDDVVSEDIKKLYEHTVKQLKRFRKENLVQEDRPGYAHLCKKILKGGRILELKNAPDDEVRWRLSNEKKFDWELEK